MSSHRSPTRQQEHLSQGQQGGVDEFYDLKEAMIQGRMSSADRGKDTLMLFFANVAGMIPGGIISRWWESDAARPRRWARDLIRNMSDARGNALHPDSGWVAFIRFLGERGRGQEVPEDWLRATSWWLMDLYTEEA